MTDAEPHCSYQRMENGIHYLVFLKSTNRAMDECLAHLATIYDQHPPGERLLYLFDMRPAGLPPLRYMISVTRKFFADRYELPETRAAYIYKESALVRLGQAFLDLLRLKTERRFYPSEREDEAIAWLLEDSPIAPD